MKVLNIIEPAVEEKIKVSNTTLYVATAKLEELEYWEKRMDRLDADYVIAEYEEDSVHPEYGCITRKHFGLFTNINKERRNVRK